MKIINLVVALYICLFSVMANAQTPEYPCSPDVFKAVQQHLKAKNFNSRQDGGSVISAVCRFWPPKSNQLIAVFAFDEGVEYEKRLVVIILDEQTKRVSSSYQSEISEDAVTEVGENSFKLDIAPYSLSESVTAFGVVFTSSALGASCGEGYWGNELTLFSPEGGNLRPVAVLNLYQQRWLAGCPAATNDALWEDAMLTVSTGETSTNGLFDLVVTANITVNSIETPTGNLKDRTERHILRYDGKFYNKGESIPWWLEI